MGGCGEKASIVRNFTTKLDWAAVYSIIPMLEQEQRRHAVSIVYLDHRSQSINRKGTYILADVLAMDNSTVGAATRLLADFFPEIIYI
jgi:hypothetical protein